MSTSSQSLSASLPDQTTSRWRRFRFPLSVLVGSAILFAIPWALDALDYDVPVYISMLIYWAPMLAVVLITFWWLFFSGYRWYTRVGVACLVSIGVISFFYFSVRKFEMDLYSMALLPRLHFVWETSPEEKLNRYLEEHPEKNANLDSIVATIGPEDYPRYRGPRADGVVSFMKLKTGWQAAPPHLLWKHPCAGGYSGIAVAGNIAVTLEQRDTKETVVCYDRNTGQQRWAYAYDAYHRDVMGDGPRSTPTIHNERIFSVGASGDLVCLDATGKLQWALNILKDNQAQNIKWGLSGSPLIVKDLIVVHAGIDPKAPASSALVAYEQATGKKRWHAGNRPAGYSSPQLAQLCGAQQILLFDGDGLVSYAPDTGKELWHSPWVTEYDMNSIQPVVLGDDRVFISSEASNGCALLRVQPPAEGSTTWKINTLWQNKTLAARFANPVTDGKYIYGLHGLPGIIKCLDANDGKVLWRGERYGAGQMLLANDLLIVVSDKGMVSLVAADAKQYQELDRFAVFNDKTWNTPSLAGDQLFLRNQREIACLQLQRR